MKSKVRVIVNTRGWVCVVVALFILIFATLGAVMLVQNQKATQGYVKTEAIVVDNDQRYDYSEHEYYYRAIVEYTVDGMKYRATNTAESQNSPYRIGKSVTIAYDPNDPNRVEFVGSRKFFATMCFVVSGVCFIILIVQIILRFKTPKMIYKGNDEDNNNILVA